VKTFTINLPLTSINEELIGRVQTIVNKHPGNASLRFVVMDTAENMKIELPSRKLRVKAENELFNELDAMVPEGNWKIN
jgi:DNA polymerase-3 subunit alpha